MALARYEVTGMMPIRDAVTKESILPGGIVTLDDEPVVRKQLVNGRPAKPLAATNIAALIESGLIKPASAKAEKKA